MRLDVYVAAGCEPGPGAHVHRTDPRGGTAWGARQIYGIGEFGVDSFNIFCRGDVSCNPNDRCLKSFCDWQRRRNNKNK